MKTNYTLRMLMLFCSAAILQSATAQTTCSSAYDNAFNDFYIPSHYSPGPMTVPLNTSFNGRIDKANDVDYYKFFITTGGSITLSLNNLPANYNLRLTSENGSVLATSARSGTSAESITFNVASNSSYFALVYPANSKTFNANSCYTLRISTGTASRVAVEGEGVEAEADFYPNPASSRLHIHVGEEQENALIRLINASGRVVLEKHAQQADEVADISMLPAGPYFLQINAADGSRLLHKKLIKQ